MESGRIFMENFFRLALPSPVTWACIFLLCFIIACAPAEKFVYLLPVEGPDIVLGSDFLIYDDGILNIRIEAVKGEEKKDIANILKYKDTDAFNSDHLVMRLIFKKQTSDIVSINFDRVYLFYGQYDFKVPLNYFDLFMIAEQFNDSVMHKFIRDHIKRGRLDLQQDIVNTAYLIFDSFRPEQRTANLLFQDVFVDSESVDIQIHFSVNEIDNASIAGSLGF